MWSFAVFSSAVIDEFFSAYFTMFYSHDYLFRYIYSNENYSLAIYHQVRAVCMAWYFCYVNHYGLADNGISNMYGVRPRFPRSLRLAHQVVYTTVGYHMELLHRIQELCGLEFARSLRLGLFVMFTSMALQTTAMLPVRAGCGPAARRAVYSIKEFCNLINLGVSNGSGTALVCWVRPRLRAVFAAWAFCNVYHHGNVGHNDSAYVGRVRPR